MMTIKTFTFNPIQTNTYVVYDETNECVIIDAACYYPEEFDELNAYIVQQMLKPVRMINTHGHVDHILGVVAMKKQYQVEPEIHSSEIAMVEAAPQYGAMFGLECTEWPVITTFITESDQIKFGNSFLDVIHTPGHTVGGLCFYQPQEKVLFTGDTLFAGSIGRTDLPGGDYDVLMNSINKKLLVLDESVKVYSGHGSLTTIGYEKRNNPFLS